jgi:ribosome maturation factor RimP
MADARIDGDLEAELAAVASHAGCELVHAEFRGGTLRIYLDRPEGVTVDDCTRVSKEVSALLDVLDFGRGRYTLEVSSPGLDRQLYRSGDYERFVGRLIRLTRTDPETRAKETFVGRLEEFRPAVPEPESVVVVAESQSGRRREVPLADVKTARLEIEL